MHKVSANGASIAAIGRSTRIVQGDACLELVSEALAFGYRHVVLADAWRCSNSARQTMKMAAISTLPSGH
ncbi:hypothetical protein PV773_04225 [Mesorhizobium sp. CC13]|uniref:hypothetical protein n=1 Tax=Mesorhizobium sp. CC13 TaxID=3029194 RepID=UPI003267FB84